MKSICLDSITLVKEVGGFIKSQVNTIKQEDIEVKGYHDFVSYVDKTAQDKLIAGLTGFIKDAGFIAEEENTHTISTDYNWVIDPLDGTTNFLHGLPLYSVSVGLIYRNKPVMGIVYEINQDECFYAWKDNPAFLNGKEIHVSTCKTIDNSLLVTGFPYYDYKYLDNYMELLKHLMKQSSGIRRLGSAAVDLAYVAAGRFEAFYEYCLKPWDVAGGAMIVQQAGGKVTDFSGGNNYLFGQEIVASNALINDELMRIVKEYFKDTKNEK